MKRIQAILVIMIFMISLFSVSSFADDEDDRFEELDDIKEKIKKAKQKNKKKNKGLTIQSAAITLLAVGDFCTGIGKFKNGKCKLTGDVTSPIVIPDAGVELNCKGFSVIGSGAGIGITVESTGTGVTIKKCDVTGWEVGIISDADDVVIKKNTLSNNLVASIAIDDPNVGGLPSDNIIFKNEIVGTAPPGAGINGDIIAFAKGTTVEKNTVTGQSDAQVLFFESPGPSIINNNFFYEPTRIIGFAAVAGFSRGTVNDNTFEFLETGAVQGVSIQNGGGSSVNNNKFTLGVAGCDRVGASCPGGVAVMVRLFNGAYDVINNKFTGTGKSAQAMLGSNVGGTEFTDNTLKDLQHIGVEVQNGGVSGGVDISRNTIGRTGDNPPSGDLAAIRVQSVGTATNYLIEDNLITDSDGIGISFEAQGGTLSASTIQGNEIKNSLGDGLVLKNVAGNTITRNIIEDNDDGIELIGSASNTITLNDIFNNNGFQINSGAAIEVSDGVRGNYWGRTCPVLFIPGTDSNMVSVVDSFPFDAPVAGFVGLPTPTVCI